MNIKNYYFHCSLALFCFLLMSCQSPLTPLQVGENFWLGMQHKNIALIKKYSVPDSVLALDDREQLSEVSDYTFGKIIIDGDVTEIETNVTIQIDKQSRHVQLKTFLIYENEVWKVDYEKTVQPLLLDEGMTKLLRDIQELSEEFAEKIKEDVEEFRERVMPEIKSTLEQAEQELRQKLPELKSIINEFLQELEKSIEEAMPPPDENKTQET